MNDDLIIYEGTEYVLRPEAQEWKCFLNLLAQDTTVKKLLYKAQLRYLYYVHSKSSPLSDRYTPGERERIFFEQVETKYTAQKIKSFELKECIPIIRRHSMLRSEAQLENILEDFDRLLNHLNSIPWEIEVKEEIHEGKKKGVRSFMRSNNEEKMKAFKSSKDLMALQKEVEKIMKDERKTIAAGGGKKRMFEDPESMKYT